MTDKKPINFKIERKLDGCLGRVGILETPHGVIHTPAFVVVGTKGTIKALSPEQVESLGAEVVLANTYHLYLQPGDERVRDLGGLNKFMNWHGPTMTDSGGFQVFSLGIAYEYGISKFISSDSPLPEVMEEAYAANRKNKKAHVTEDGVTFQSIIDGREHFLSPEKSIKIQNSIGADIIFAFDECTSPHATHEYIKEAMERTHRWAERSLMAHHSGPMKEKQALFGIVQGGRHKDLREESAKIIGAMDFDGFGIGGSFIKEDMNEAVKWVNDVLPEEKPKHLLGVGEPEDLFSAVENGCDLFDCVAPTRIARNGALYTKAGKINITNAQFVDDKDPIDAGCECYTCKNYTRAYVSHLFRAKEMFAATLASIHNLYFIVHLVKAMREAILDDKFFEFKNEFLKNYKNL